MKKKVFTFITILFVSTILGQKDKTCNSDKKELSTSLNSIKKKCSVKASTKEGKDNARMIAVRVSATRSRFLKKRTAISQDNVEKLKENVSSVGNLTTNDVSNYAYKIKPDDLEKMDLVTAKTLSDQQVRNADKFSTVDRIPAFEECKGFKKQKEQLKCFSENMVTHIESYFNYPNEAIMNKIQGKVWIRFIIDEKGNVTNVQARTIDSSGGDTKILDQEAIRVVANLKKFIPAEKDGEKVSVKYGFPISFSLED